MTCRTGRGNLDQQGVIIAVVEYLFDIQNITRLLPFCPQSLPAAAVKGHTPGIARNLQRLIINPCHHQHPAGFSILDYCRFQFFSIRFHRFNCFPFIFAIIHPFSFMPFTPSTPLYALLPPKSPKSPTSLTPFTPSTPLCHYAITPLCHYAITPLRPPP